MRKKYTVETGQSFGDWTVADVAVNPRKPLCRCVCGVERHVMIRDLCMGDSTGCGCARRAMMRQVATARNTTHGLKHHKHYMRWLAMRARCRLPRSKGFHRYGGRGIRVCDEWNRSAEAFITYLDTALGPCPEGYTLDRIDNDGNYEPGNVRWADGSTQAQNRAPRAPGGPLVARCLSSRN